MLNRSLMRWKTTHSTGTNNNLINVADTMPQTTTGPTATHLAAPAPEANSNGITPRINERAVIITARNRSLAASNAAASIPKMASRRVLANSTIKIALWDAKPINMTNPILAYRLLSSVGSSIVRRRYPFSTV